MKKFQFEVNEIPKMLKDTTDSRWRNNTIYNHFEGPMEFMDAVMEFDGTPEATREGQKYINQGKAAFKKIEEFDVTYSKVYLDVAETVKKKLISKGFTTSMLYADVKFTTRNTGMMSKQRVMLGRRDCYFESGDITDGKLFHDIYINLSYSGGIPDSQIRRNAYALYALAMAMSKLLSIRVIVVNHVGTSTPCCYSYVLKKFGQVINPEQFLFFTSDSKRTFGWATYNILMKRNGTSATVGNPTNTASIANFSLDREIESIFEVVTTRAPELLRAV